MEFLISKWILGLCQHSWNARGIWLLHNSWRWSPFSWWQTYSEIEELAKRINDLTGMLYSVCYVWSSVWAWITDLWNASEVDTGFSPSSQWDVVSDKKMMLEEPLLVSFISYNNSLRFLLSFLHVWITCRSLHAAKWCNPNTEDAKYVWRQTHGKVYWIPELIMSPVMCMFWLYINCFCFSS